MILDTEAEADWIKAVTLARHGALDTLEGLRDPSRRHYGPGPHKNGTSQNVHGANFGDTVSPVDGRRPTTGYQVGQPTGSMIIPRADWKSDDGKEATHRFLEHNREIFRSNPDVFMGVWLDKNKQEIDLDVSHNVQDLDQALRMARDWDQQAIWDNVNQTVIMVGGTGAREHAEGGRSTSSGLLGLAQGEAARVDRAASAGGRPGLDPEVAEALQTFWSERRWGGAYEQPRHPAGTSKGGQFAPKEGAGLSGHGTEVTQQAGDKYLTDDGERARIDARMAEIGVTPEGTKAAMRARLAAARTMADPYPIDDREPPETAFEGGSKWFGRAHGECVLIGDGDPSRGAAVAAALSAQCPWPNNVNAAYALRDLTRRYPRLSADEIAEKFLGDDYAGIRAQYGNVHPQDRTKLVKGVELLRGADPAKVLAGQKVRNFYNSITTSTDVGAVTIDGHMLKIMMKTSNVPPDQRSTVGAKYLGATKVGAWVDGQKTGTGDGYAFMSAMVKDVAAEMRMEPRQVQAILWNTAVEEKWTT